MQLSVLQLEHSEDREALCGNLGVDGGEGPGCATHPGRSLSQLVQDEPGYSCQQFTTLGNSPCPDTHKYLQVQDLLAKKREAKASSSD